MQYQAFQKILNRERKARQIKKQANQSLKDFSVVLFLAGDKYHEYLQKETEVYCLDCQDKNLKVEERIQEIAKLDQSSNFPVIWFKNISAISRNQEKTFLALFDNEQNTELFHQQVDLSKFILVATNSQTNLGNLSNPLTSRLDLINVQEITPKQFF